MAELSKEELALLAAEEPAKPRRRRPLDSPAESGAVEPKVERDEPKVEQEVSADANTTAPATPQAARGPLTPIQYGGDGWGDTPVQMRG